MGGLVVKQILYKAKEENFDNLVNNTIGIVRLCSHFFKRKIVLQFLHFFLMLYVGFRFSIAVHILVANLQICLGEWVLCFALLQRLVSEVTCSHATVHVEFNNLHFCPINFCIWKRFLAIIL